MYICKGIIYFTLFIASDCQTEPKTHEGNNSCYISHRVLVQMEGTAHIDFPKFKTAKAINFKILPVMHM